MLVPVKDWKLIYSRLSGCMFRAIRLVEGDREGIAAGSAVNYASFYDKIANSTDMIKWLVHFPG
jgi:hypothetical protein